MRRKKHALGILLLSLVLGFSTVPVKAQTSLETPTSVKKIETNPTAPLPSPPPLDLKKISPETQAEIKQLSDTLHEEDRAISNEIRDEEELSLKDIGMLWQAAVERSGTIRYAIEKLSRRDTLGKPVNNDSFTKRMLQSVARVGGMAGSVWTKSPTSLLGGNMVDQMLTNDPTKDPSLSKVTDADMLILAKEIEALQSQLIEAYYSYCHSQEQWQLAQEASENLKQHYDRVTQASTPEALTLQPIIESLYEGLTQQELSAKQNFISARNALGLMVGSDALVALEEARQKDAQSTSAAAVH